MIEQVKSKEEVEALSELAKEIWTEYFPGIITVEQVNYMLEKFLSVPVLEENLEEGYECYFLKDGEDKIGFFMIHPEEERLFLSKVYVDKPHREKGYSSEAFQFIEKRAKELGLDKIYLTVNKRNQHPIDVYEHNGFEQIDSVVTDIGGGFVMDDYIYQKSID